MPALARHRIGGAHRRGGIAGVVSLAKTSSSSHHRASAGARHGIVASMAYRHGWRLQPPHQLIRRSCGIAKHAAISGGIA